MFALGETSYELARVAYRCTPRCPQRAWNAQGSRCRACQLRSDHPCLPLAMTSHIISTQVSHASSSEPTWKEYSDSPDKCVFCRIIRNELAAFKVYEDPEGRAAAFLDILPIRPGHTLVVPRSHVRRLTDLSEEDAAALGKAVVKVGKAVTEGARALHDNCRTSLTRANPCCVPQRLITRV